jgi:predicted CoA-binding protein
MKRNVLVLGASTNTSRFSYLAITKLLRYGHEVHAIAPRQGQIEDVIFDTEQIEYHNIDTVTLYLSAPNQASYYDYILKLKPERVIFNPGTENPELESLLEENKIEAIQNCTLVMLDAGIF